MVKQNRVLLDPVSIGDWKAGFRAPSAPRDHKLVQQARMDISCSSQDET